MFPPVPSYDPNGVDPTGRVDPGSLPSTLNAQISAQPSLLRQILAGFQRDVGLGPMPLGVVAGGPGGAQLAETLAKEAGSLQNPTDAALRYMALKYPKLMGGVDVNPMAMRSTVAGSFRPYNWLLRKVMPSKTGVLSVNTAVDTTAPQAVDTIGHELTHSIQAGRTPALLKQAPGPSAAYAEYFNHPAEVNARQGGATAASTLQRFLQTYPQLQALFGGQK